MKKSYKIMFFIILGIFAIGWIHLGFSIAPNPQTYCKEKYGSEFKFNGDKSKCVNDNEIKNYDSFEFEKVCVKPGLFDLTKWRTICEVE